MQFVFAGWSQWQWYGQTSTIELCGSNTASNDDPYGLTIYGVGQWQNDTSGAATVETEPSNLQVAGQPYAFPGVAGITTQMYSGGALKGTYTGGTLTGFVPTDMFTAANDNSYAILTGGPASTLSADVTIPANFVPAGAYVDSLMLKVSHAEKGQFSNMFVKVTSPATGTGTWNSSSPVATGGLPACEQPTYTQTISPLTTSQLVVGNYYNGDDPTQSGSATAPDEYDTSVASSGHTGCGGASSTTYRWMYGSEMMRVFKTPTGR